MKWFVLPAVILMSTIGLAQTPSPQPVPQTTGTGIPKPVKSPAELEAALSRATKEILIITPGLKSINVARALIAMGAKNVKTFIIVDAVDLKARDSYLGQLKRSPNIYIKTMQRITAWEAIIDRKTLIASSYLETNKPSTMNSVQVTIPEPGVYPQVSSFNQIWKMAKDLK